jgi:hypothetical protein
MLETYVKRLEALEAIANSYKGVQKSFAMQAGREIRIMVDAGQVNDDKAFWIAKDVTKRIEGDAVPRADQGHGHARDPGGGVRPLKSFLIENGRHGRMCPS